MSLFFVHPSVCIPQKMLILRLLKGSISFAARLLGKERLQRPKAREGGKITIDRLKTIAQEKLPDLDCTTIESAMRIIAGTAANMGIGIDPPVLEPKKKQLLQFRLKC